MKNKLSLKLIIISMVFMSVLNTILISLYERKRELSIMLAVGLRPLNLFNVIILEVIALAFLGSAVGLVLVFPVHIWLMQVGIELKEPFDIGGFRFSHLKGELSLFTLVFPFILLTLSSVLSAIPPSLSMINKSPSESMRDL